MLTWGEVNKWSLSTAADNLSNAQVITLCSDSSANSCWCQYWLHSNSTTIFTHTFKYLITHLLKPSSVLCGIQLLFLHSSLLFFFYHLTKTVFGKIWPSSVLLCVCLHPPSLLGLLVDVGQYVSSTASPLTHHHWDGRALLEVLEHRQDHVGTPLQDQSHNRNTLTNTCRKENIYDILKRPSSLLPASASHVKTNWPLLYIDLILGLRSVWKCFYYWWHILIKYLFWF